ncbi:hypothetical protein ACIA98_31230 [Streptomyces sp. NPDC051366]
MAGPLLWPMADGLALGAVGGLAGAVHRFRHARLQRHLLTYG